MKNLVKFLKPHLFAILFFAVGIAFLTATGTEYLFKLGIIGAFWLAYILAINQNKDLRFYGLMALVIAVVIAFVVGLFFTNSKDLRLLEVVTGMILGGVFGITFGLNKGVVS